MNLRRFNWQIWLGFVVSVFALMSYPLIFSAWPITRDFPWVNLLLFAIAVLLLFIGVRRAFGPGRGRWSKIGASILAGLSVVVLGLFVMVAFIAARWMPESAGAPQLGQKAPDFALTDTNGRQVSLSELLSAPVKPGGSSPKGVLLVFYRGYW